VLGDSMAMPVGAMVRKFRDEFEAVMADPELVVDPHAVVRGAPETLGAST
jgi:hypothetical protein